jgi:hypothetical protein
MLIAFMIDENTLREFKTSKGSINEPKIQNVILAKTPEAPRHGAYSQFSSVLVQFAG